MPKEDFPLTRGYLTKPVFVASDSDSFESTFNTVLKGPSLLDALIIGILSRLPDCALKVLDVSGFEEGKQILLNLSNFSGYYKTKTGENNAPWLTRKMLSLCTINRCSIAVGAHSSALPPPYIGRFLVNIIENNSNVHNLLLFK